MRILWLGAISNPWTEGESGWQYLQNLGIDVVRASSADEFRTQMQSEVFACLVLEAEIAEAKELHAEIKSKEGSAHTIFLSSSWTKSDFRKHAKSGSAADRYAPLPMPSDAFAEVVAGLCGTTVAALQEQASAVVAAGDLFASNAAATDLSPTHNTEDQLGGADALISSADSFSPQQHSAVSEETDTLRKYLQLREQEIAELQAVKAEYEREHARLQNLEGEQQTEIERLQGENTELGVRLEQLDSRISEMERAHQTEKETWDFELKSAQERQREADQQLQDSTDRLESMKARVRKDVHQIRIRERELEAKLEMLRKDSETILSTRDQQVIQLQQQIDELEYDLDQIQDKRVEAETQAERYLAKLSRVARALHLALDIVESENISIAKEADATFNNLLQELGKTNEAATAGAAEANEGAAVLAAMQAAQEASGGETRVMSSPENAAASGNPAAGMSAAPAAEAAPAADAPSIDFNALANDGEATRFVSMSELEAAAAKDDKEQAG